MGASMLKGIVFVAVATALIAPAAAQDCQLVTRKSTPWSELTAFEGAVLVLRRGEVDKNPYLIEEKCITVDSSFWPRNRRGRFLYLGVVNYVPSEDDPDVSFLGVQAARKNPFE